MTGPGSIKVPGLLDGHFNIEVARLAEAVLRRSPKPGHERELAWCAARVAVSSHLQRSRDRIYAPFKVSPWITAAARELSAIGLGIEFERMIVEAILDDLVRARLRKVHSSKARPRTNGRLNG